MAPQRFYGVELFREDLSPTGCWPWGRSPRSARSPPQSGGGAGSGFGVKLARRNLIGKSGWPWSAIRWRRFPSFISGKCYHRFPGRPSQLRGPLAFYFQWGQYRSGPSSGARARCALVGSVLAVCTELRRGMDRARYLEGPGPAYFLPRRGPKVLCNHCRA